MAKRKLKNPAKRRGGKNSAFVSKEITSLVSAGVAIFLSISIWFGSGGSVGEGITLFFRGLFGDVAYLLPLIIIAGVMTTFFYNEKLKRKLWIISLLPIELSMLRHLMHRVADGQIIWGAVKLYGDGIKGTGGGVLGGIFADPLIYATGLSGSFILGILILLVMIVLFFEISVIAIFKGFCRKVRDFFASLKESYDNYEEPEPKAPPQKKKQAEKQSDTPLEDYRWKEHQEIVIPHPLEELPVDQITLPDTEIAAMQAASEDIPAYIKSENLSPQTDENYEQLQLDGAPKAQYVHPLPELLEKSMIVPGAGKVELLKANAQRLIEILESFGIEARITNIVKGASVTRYEILPASGVKVNKITTLDQDIALRLPASNVRMEVQAGSIGIEVSNDSVTAINLREIIESSEFRAHPSKLAVALGRDIEGKTVVMDIAKAPHLLIAGATGSGKSVCINTIITSILYKSSPEDVRFVMVDPKKVELGMYNGIPHLLVPIVTDPRKAAGALCWAVQEMEDRYKKFAESQARDLAGYNRKMEQEEGEKLPQIVIIIDELSDLMMVAPGEVQDYICRLAQMARAAGMHLVLATQRPSVDVITGIIKINIPSRIAFAVASQVDSRTILDGGGAEKLMGRGDMLFMMTGSKMRRVQGAFISDKDVENVTGFIKDQAVCTYSENVIETIESKAIAEHAKEDDSSENDELMDEAAEIAFELNQISTSMLQRKLKVGYARAGRLIDVLEKHKVISAYDGTNKPRQVTMGRSEYLEMRNR